MAFKMPAILQKLWVLLDAFAEDIIRRTIRFFDVILDALTAAVSSVKGFVVACVVIGLGYDVISKGKFGIITFAVQVFKDVLNTITASTSTAIVFVGLLFLIYGFTKK